MKKNQLFLMVLSLFCLLKPRIPDNTFHVSFGLIVLANT